MSWIDRCDMPDCSCHHGGVKAGSDCEPTRLGHDRTLALLMRRLLAVARERGGLSVVAAPSKRGKAFTDVTIDGETGTVRVCDGTVFLIGPDPRHQRAFHLPKRDSLAVANALYVEITQSERLARERAAERERRVTNEIARREAYRAEQERKKTDQARRYDETREQMQRAKIIIGEIGLSLALDVHVFADDGKVHFTIKDDGPYSDERVRQVADALARSGLFRLYPWPRQKKAAGQP